MEKHADGDLTDLRFPGLAIKQARFLALNSMKRDKTQDRVLSAVPDPPDNPDVEQVVADRERIDRILDAVATCSPTAKTIFRMVYAPPYHSHADTAREVGLSLQRVRQILCETRKHIRKSIGGQS